MRVDGTKLEDGAFLEKILIKEQYILDGQHQVRRVFQSSANRLDNLHFAGAMGNVL